MLKAVEISMTMSVEVSAEAQPFAKKGDLRPERVWSVSSSVSIERSWNVRRR